MTEVLFSGIKQALKKAAIFPHNPDGARNKQPEERCWQSFFTVRG